MSGFNAVGGPQSLAENAAQPLRRSPARAKARRLLRRGIVSRDAVKRMPRHDYDRTGVMKDDTIEGSTA